MDRDEALRFLRGGSEGVAEWNRRRKSGEEIPDLSSARFGSANLSGANLSDANLRQADLSGASLNGADLNSADLSRANLNSADLTAVNLSWAVLRGANLSKAVCWYTLFTDTDLSEVEGLVSINHRGPSTIGLDTLFFYKGQIPDAFLRGCGVPEALIKYLPSLIGSMSPIQFHSCFISYSSKNRDFAERLHADLQAKGVRCWFDHEDLKIGERFRHQIDKAIRVHDKLMLVLSADSIGSDWVEAEVETVFDRERTEKRTVLFPIRLDNTILESPVAWASHIRRTRHIGDFTGWKDHDSFQAAFARLLRDLQASGEGVVSTPGASAASGDG